MKLSDLIKITDFSVWIVPIMVFMTLMKSPQALAIIDGYINMYSMTDAAGETLNGANFARATLLRSFKVTSSSGEGPSLTRSYEITPLPGTGQAPPHPTWPARRGQLLIRTEVLKQSTSRVTVPKQEGDTSNQPQDKPKPKNTTKRSKRGDRKKEKTGKKGKVRQPDDQQQSASIAPDTGSCSRPLKHLPRMYQIAATDNQPKTIGFTKIPGTNRYQMTLDGFQDYLFYPGMEKAFEMNPDTFLNAWMNLEQQFSRYGRNTGGSIIDFFPITEIKQATTFIARFWQTGFADPILGLTCDFRIRALFVGNAQSGYVLAGIHANLVVPEQNEAAANTEPPVNLFFQFVPAAFAGGLGTYTATTLDHYINPHEDVDNEWNTSPEQAPQPPVHPASYEPTTEFSGTDHVPSVLTYIPGSPTHSDSQSGSSSTTPQSLTTRSLEVPLHQSVSVSPPHSASCPSPASMPVSRNYHQETRGWLTGSSSVHTSQQISGSLRQRGNRSRYEPIRKEHMSPPDSGPYMTVRQQPDSEATTSSPTFVISSAPAAKIRSRQSAVNYQNVMPGSHGGSVQPSALDLPPRYHSITPLRPPKGNSELDSEIFLRKEEQRRKICLIEEQKFLMAELDRQKQKETKEETGTDDDDYINVNPFIRQTEEEIEEETETDDYININPFIRKTEEEIEEETETDDYININPFIRKTEEEKIEEETGTNDYVNVNQLIRNIKPWRWDKDPDGSAGAAAGAMFGAGSPPI